VHGASINSGKRPNNIPIPFLVFRQSTGRSPTIACRAQRVAHLLRTHE
jgi:hypothetical protein